jgi:hypothetical protein
MMSAARKRSSRSRHAPPDPAHPTTAAVDRELSARVAKAVQASPTLRWYNAWRALALSQKPGTRALAIKQLKAASYIEGWVVTLDPLDLPREHGWLELEDKLIDPMMFDRPVAYFPGLRCSWAEALACKSHPQMLLPLSRHAGLSLAHFLDYLRAELAATEFLADHAATEYTLILNYLRKNIAHVEAQLAAP